MTDNLIQARNQCRIDLSDMDGSFLDDDQIDRAYQRAVDDVTRFMPDEDVYELTLVFAVSAESFTTAAAHGTWASLANKPIRYQSETVTSADGLTTYTRDTDYYMDYFNGKITTISGGSMVVATAYLISYDKSKIAVDISAIISDLIRIQHVEYPVGNVPQKFASYSIWGDSLYIGSQEAKTNQAQLADNNHVAIYYEKPHTMPTVTARGSYPAFLDQVVALGATAYMLYMEAVQQELQAVTDLASARTALGYLAAIHVLSDAALDKVNTYLASQTSENTNYWLGKITTDAATLRTLIASTLVAVEAQIPLADANVDSADAVTTTTYTDAAAAFLALGDDKINVVNLGESVAAEYRQYAVTELQMADIILRGREDFLEAATKRSSLIGTGIQAAATRLNLMESYLTQAEAYRKMGETFIYESTGRLGEMDRYISEATKYVEAAQQCQYLSEKLRADADSKRNEFWTILKDKAEWKKRAAFVPVVQANK
jgi:hypothetical protein